MGGIQINFGCSVGLGHIDSSTSLTIKNKKLRNNRRNDRNNGGNISEKENGF